MRAGVVGGYHLIDPPDERHRVRRARHGVDGTLVASQKLLAAAENEGRALLVTKTRQAEAEGNAIRIAAERSASRRSSAAKASRFSRGGRQGHQPGGQGDGVGGARRVAHPLPMWTEALNTSRSSARQRHLPRRLPGRNGANDAAMSALQMAPARSSPRNLSGPERRWSYPARGKALSRGRRRSVRTPTALAGGSRAALPQRQVIEFAVEPAQRKRARKTSRPRARSWAIRFVRLELVELVDEVRSLVDDLAEVGDHFFVRFVLARLRLMTTRSSTASCWRGSSSGESSPPARRESASRPPRRRDRASSVAERDVRLLRVSSITVPDVVRSRCSWCHGRASARSQLRARSSMRPSSWSIQLSTSPCASAAHAPRRPGGGSEAR